MSAASGLTAATLEFVVASSSERDFFPVVVTFEADDTICPVSVAAVTHLDSQEPAKFGLFRQLQTDRYEIVAQPE